MQKHSPAIQVVSFFKRTMLTIIVFLIVAFTFAQEKKVDVDINVNKGGNFFASPWVWVVGAAVFILLLVALLRGGGRKSA